jgi:hypothetical protein
MTETRDLVAYVDVDDTLVRSFGSKRIPMTEMVRHVRELKYADAVYGLPDGTALPARG